MSEPMRLVAVLTHWDDESGECAATLARYVAAGHEVMVVTCTGDENGAVASAIEILGVGHHRLGFTESGRQPREVAPPGRFASVPLDEPTERLVRVLREFRPHVVITYDRTGDAHADYVRCHDASVAAFDAAGDPVRFPAAGAPWQPLKLYYVHEWYEERITALHEALLAEGLESPYHEWLEKQPGGPERITTRVPCGEYFSVRDRALRSHATRIDPDGRWFAVPVRVRRAVWPTEDFELARCYVETSLPEDDLFAGISPQ